MSLSTNFVGNVARWPSKPEIKRALAVAPAAPETRHTNQISAFHVAKRREQIGHRVEALALAVGVPDGRVRVAHILGRVGQPG
ncbi:MAG: hypothetical protein KKB66_16030 [Alphaproteobacteria bacterium]|nr:hypothetical protein [Alphaproteobacteria bacterium]MBU0804316.1 hypothetical protein [Alphaproteobacteria bacterium]MBU0871147.1 hypothetical protein [Alphaproteobacteria bacterium]MBU1400902.1 hypothetical protein [Alphaproteobacteria bacterium]MBU1592681.1 hypothetical protein [Alphaproteobacteria bacterium]